MFSQQKQILLIAPNAAPFKEALNPFVSQGFEINNVANLNDALKKLDPTKPPSLIILGLEFSDVQEMRHACMQILNVCALTNIAVVSNIDKDTLHDALEGLGTLGVLSLTPTEEEGSCLLKKLQRICKSL